MSYTNVQVHQLYIRCTTTDTNDQLKYSSMATADFTVAAAFLAPTDVFACHGCCGFSLLHYGNQRLRSSTNLTSSWSGPRNLGHTTRDAFLWLTVLACGSCCVFPTALGADTYFVSVHSIALLNADPIKTGFGGNRTRLWTLWGWLCVVPDPLLDRSVLCSHHKMYGFPWNRQLCGLH